MLLALDSATRQAGICLFDGESVRAEALWSSSRVYHTEWLTPAIAQSLARINATAADLTVVAVTTGPGSFTGLRVALSVAKGIAAARGLPIIGIPSLDATAEPWRMLGLPVIATLSAGRGRHAWQCFATPDMDETPLPATPIIETIKEIAAQLADYQGPTMHFVGELTVAERRYLAETVGDRVRVASVAQSVRRPAVVAELAWQRYQRGEFDDLDQLEPLYLRLNATA